MKRRIRLTEKELKAIIKESVRRIVNEETDYREIGKQIGQNAGIIETPDQHTLDEISSAAEEIKRLAEENQPDALENIADVISFITELVDGYNEGRGEYDDIYDEEDVDGEDFNDFED